MKATWLAGLYDYVACKILKEKKKGLQTDDWFPGKATFN